MIRKSWSHDKWMLTHQAEHARLAGLIASAWNFGTMRPSDEALYAIAHHDDGWKAEDEAPRTNRHGDPMNFMEIDAPSALAIWTLSSASLAEERRFYAARLVAGHFAWLAENTIDLARLNARQAVAVGKFIFDQRQLMEKWRKEGLLASHSISARDTKLMVGPEESGADAQSRFARDLRFLQVCDQLSLLLCTDFVGDQVIHDVPYLDGSDKLTVTRRGELALTLSPFPLRMKLRDHVSCYLLPKHRYESDNELREAVSGTKPTINEIHFGKKDEK